MQLEHEYKFPLPNSSRLSISNKYYKEIINLHEKACRNKFDTYIDPETGFNVFTVYHHLNRGSCCGNGCRHCPFGI